MSCNEESMKKLQEYALSKFLDGGMDIGASDIMRQYAIYEEYKDKLYHVVNKQTAARIVLAVENNFSTIFEKVNAIEKAVTAILDGADLSEIRSYSDIERQHTKVIMKQHFGDMDKEDDSKNHVGTKGLEEYSTTQLKAELRRRRSQPQGKGKDFRLEE